MKNLQPSQIIDLLTPPFGFDLAEYEETGVIGENHGYSRKLKVNKEASIKSLIEALETSDNDLVRRFICEILGWRKAVSAIPAIARCLDSESEPLRYEAADSLGDTGSPKAGEPLLARFKIENSARVKTTLALSLGACRYKPAATCLKQCLPHQDAKLREFSAYALGRIGAREYLADLQNLLKTEGDPTVIHRLHKAIEQIENRPEN